MNKRAIISLSLIISVLLSAHAFSYAENETSLTDNNQTEQTDQTEQQQTTNPQPDNSEIFGQDSEIPDINEEESPLPNEEEINSEAEDNNDSEVSQPNQEENMDEGGISIMSIDNPTKATLSSGSHVYAAPSSSTGHKLRTTSSTETCWIVEKIPISGSSNYFLYVGFSNGTRGYVGSDRVRYYNTTTPISADYIAGIADETKPAGFKVHTSLSATVYYGPGTSYEVMGSVGEESIKLIRSEGNYNFILYTVTSTGKLKRGYIHHSKITGSWPTLTENLSSSLDGKVVYIKNVSTNSRMHVLGFSVNNNAPIVLNSADTVSTQKYKLQYNASGKYFTIMPLSSIGTEMTMTIQTYQQTELYNRQAQIYHNDKINNQKFWIVISNGHYKILPLSHYGTMTLRARYRTDKHYVETYYTSNGAEYDLWDITECHSSATSQCINLMFDNGLVQREMGHTQAVAAANALYYAGRDFWADRFKCNIIKSYVTRITSSSDECNNSAGCDTLDEHDQNSTCFYSENSIHHKNVGRNLALLNSGTPALWNVCINGHRCCITQDYQHKDGIVWGVTGLEGLYKSIVFKYYYNYEEYANSPYHDWDEICDDYDVMYKTTFIHELGHLYGTNDHYNTIYGDYRDNCIYGINKDTDIVAKNNSLCPNCEKILERNRIGGNVANE